MQQTTCTTCYIDLENYIVNTKTVKQRNATHTRILVYNPKLNMAALVKQLIGVDEFLSNLQSLPSFHRVQEVQLEKLMTSMKQKLMDDQGFTETSKAAEEMKHFDEDQKRQLMQSIVDAYDRSNSLRKNKELQDYTNMPYVFPERVWKEMNSQTVLVKRIQIVCEWLQRIGLKNPSETSLGAITVICNWQEWSQQLPSRRDQAENHMNMKPSIRKIMKACGCYCKGPVFLPSSFQDLPAAIRKVFGAQTLGKSKI